MMTTEQIVKGLTGMLNYGGHAQNSRAVLAAAIAALAPQPVDRAERDAREPFAALVDRLVQAARNDGIETHCDANMPETERRLNAAYDAVLHAYMAAQPVDRARGEAREVTTETDTCKCGHQRVEHGPIVQAPEHRTGACLQRECGCLIFSDFATSRVQAPNVTPAMVRAARDELQSSGPYGALITSDVVYRALTAAARSGEVK